MYADSLNNQCTRWVATVRGHVFLLLSRMKIAIKLLDDEPIRPDAGVTVDGPLSGQPLFLAAIDLFESTAWLFTDNTIGFRAICMTNQPPVRYTEAKIQELRTRARKRPRHSRPPHAPLENDTGRGRARGRRRRGQLT
jgi:hypothetical protein